MRVRLEQKRRAKDRACDGGNDKTAHHQCLVEVIGVLFWHILPD